MDYIGSKSKLNKWIFDIINNSVKNDNNLSILDACSGSGAVSKYAVNLGYKVISNDLMLFPSIILNGSIGISKKNHDNALLEIKRLNSLKGIKGYFYKNYCDESKPKRLYFTAINAQRIDKIRKEIDKIKDDKIKNYLLYCSLESLSRVSNTTGVQAAFLKKFKDRAKNKFILKNEPIINGVIDTYNQDILLLLQDKKFRSKNQEDILYIDPPYNERQYGPNYHLYETFIKNDNPIILGKTGLRNWKNECYSSFCSKKKCLDFLTSIISFTTAKFIFISYNSDGILSINDIKKTFPDVRIHEHEYIRYKSDSSKTRTYNKNKLIEYIFEIKK